MEDTLKFQKGILYVRLINGKPIELFFPYETVPEHYQNFHVQDIARMRGVLSEPSFDSASECSQHGQRSGSGNLIEFRKASDKDIRAFLDRWSKRSFSTIAQWVYEVQHNVNGLAKQEKKRVARLAKKYI
jgi:hypothetical protein